MKKNTVIADGTNTEIYLDTIHQLTDEYISTLDDPEKIYENNTLFNGLIKYISINHFKKHPVDYDDIQGIDRIWDIYTGLCYKYNKYPSIIEFSMLININRDTVNSWKNQETRSYLYYDTDGNRIKDIAGWKLNHPNGEYTRELSISHSVTVKKWLAECEQNLYRGASESNKIGCIFALKANYGYVETAPKQIENPHQQVRTVEEIEAQYSEPIEGLPQMPDS